MSLVSGFTHRETSKRPKKLNQTDHKIMNTHKLCNAIAIAGLLLCATGAHAEESLWLFAKGSDTRPKGSFEIKSSDLFRTGKAAADYDFHDFRLEAEYGITSRLTLGARASVYRHDYEVFDADLQPYLQTQGGLGSRFSSTQFGGYEIGLKYNIFSPYKDALGLSVGTSYENRRTNSLDGSSIDQDVLSLTTFFQQNYLDATVAVALSPKLQYKRKSTPAGAEEELALDIAAGIAYRITPGWFIGLEYRHQSDYRNPYSAGGFDPNLQTTNISLSDLSFSVGSQYQRGNYIGPTVHYASQGWWATLGALYQFEGQGIAPGVNNTAGRNWNEQERWHIGMILGWEFGRDNGSNEFDMSDFEF